MGRLLDEDMVINALQTTKFRNDLFMDRGYARAISIIKELPTIQQEKAQLSKESTTSDMISRQAAIDALDCINGTEEVLRSLPPAQPEYRLDEWCMGCKEYDQEKHCCPRFNRVIREAAEEVRQNAQPEPAIPLLWIENEIKWLKSLDNTFSEITALQISAMVNKWRDEKK